MALDLILNNTGAITPYGVVYDNGMKLEQFYTGSAFPQYLYETPLLTLEVPIQPEIGGPVEAAYCCFIFRHCVAYDRYQHKKYFQQTKMKGNVIDS